MFRRVGTVWVLGFQVGAAFVLMGFTERTVFFLAMRVWDFAEVFSMHGLGFLV